MSESIRKYQETSLEIFWYTKTAYEQLMQELKPLTDDESERVKNELAGHIVQAAKAIMQIQKELGIEHIIERGPDGL